jgi:tRNA A37 N6-isopentenylltransferase MiaA
MNDKLQKQETEEELMERFDKEMRTGLLEEANRLRKEKGYPLITEDVLDIDTLSRLKEYEKNE